MISNNKIFNIENKSIFVAGHNGMVGSATLDELKKNQINYCTKVENHWILKMKTKF